MAALLDYGAAPDHKPHMHPFFQKATVTHASSNRPATPTLGSEGTVEDDSTNYDEDAGYTSSNAAHTEPAEATPGGKWSVDEGDDLEYENTRIKRRRVSVGQGHPLSETTKTSNADQTTLYDQLQAAAKTFEGFEPPLDCAEDQIAASEDFVSDKEDANYSLPPILSEDSVSQLKRPTPPVEAPLDASSGSVNIDLTGSPDHHPHSTDGAMDDHFSKKSKPCPPSSNKVLRTGHGKLVFSPKKSPKRASGTVSTDASGETSDANKNTNRSKKLQMKNGKFVSSLRVTLSYSAPESAHKINDILSGKSEKSGIQVQSAQAELARKMPSTGKGTHPFFLGRLSGNTQKQSDLKSDTSSDETSKSKAPKPWKEIVFESKRAFQNKNASLLHPVWPPTDIQHVRPSQVPSDAVTVRTLPMPRPKYKHALRVNADEDVLWNFSRRLKQGVDEALVRTPERKVMSGKELARLAGTLYEMDEPLNCQSASISRLEAVIESTRSFFDRGMAAGPQLWCHEYAPTCWQEVLEPQSKVLHDWLSNLKVHQVQTGKLQPKAKPPTPQKRRKRKSDEMDDFIADSDDDDARSAASGKNAILLTGPPGSGKTASVFAVAQQLGFEVFEIHPGMRRSAKDIQDKVGDMTQNHLVQHSDTPSRRSSISLEDRDTGIATSGPPPENRNPLTHLIGLGKGGKQSKIAQAKEVKDSKTKAQKQSLVLFEEVDILFEEDKAFWSGVQSLIRTSKRPVILTCNSADSVPLAELDLFAILRYGCAEPGQAVQLLGSICAAEGHLLSKTALQNLYLTKGHDLRASIMELNLWCQMTVGSQQGGLDWMLPHNDESKLKSEGSVTRIVSQDTFTSGLDLLPTDSDDTEGLIRFSQDNLNIPALGWVQNDVSSRSTESSGLSMLTDMLILSEARSAMDLIDGTTRPMVATSLRKLANPAPADASPCTSQGDEVVRLYLDELNDSQLLPLSMYDAFAPLLEESRIGLPSSPGRKAPSLDNPSAISLVTEVAPYIRCIVSHDQRLEQLRNELHGGARQHGSSKRQRRTRAARAALEGADKSTVRRDKWFPEELDWGAVMRTAGNEWPQARDRDVEAWDISSAAQTPSSSIGMEVDANEPASHKS
ncbi:uncharacterized protein Z520_01809 [Fonsecaea multimorphosa CBS 102226]|uniref:AAA+ ATPase domain-containing protein n=1 Tax=Fonsecaea multimorphosa CBS 102226 TaxID=1442371 RepID=A0A0D2IXA4_9EURO|nr:uncharacterized protein Z520_01809 [Fonsecaea multimorphosa CBS 102226]KIY01672.1 hypothetical protein Z520_01809 [Fonsecaea multimorphosa CBS 102226]OAL29867.1 hypothetical protein AYO22_01773 [Fonsecaea multimorphosa]